MIRALTRFVALLLVPCLLVDPAFATMISPLHVKSASEIFIAQAFAEQPLPSLKNNMFVSGKPGASAKIKRTLGAISRRGWLAGAAVAATGFAQNTQVPAPAPKSRYLGTMLTPVKFRKLDRAALPGNTRLVQMVCVASGLALQARNPLLAWQNNAVTPEAVEKFRQMRLEAVSLFMQTPGILPEIEHILGHPFPTNPEQQWDELIFEALPHYFGERGFLFTINYSRLSKPQPSSLAHMEMAVNFALYPILDVRPVPVQVPNWSGQPEARTEIEVDLPVNTNNKAAETAPFETRAVTDYNVIIRWPSIEKNSAKHWHDQMTGRKDVVAAVHGKEWEDVRGAWEPLNFSESKLVADSTLRPHPLSDFERWETATSHVHENGHLRDAQAGLVPLRIPWPQSWTDYETKILHPAMASELNEMMAEIRFIEPGALNDSIIRVTNLWKSPKEGIVYQTARFNWIYLLLEHIASQSHLYPRIVMDPKSPVTPKAQAAGQLNRLTYDQWTSAWDAIHSQWEKEGRPLIHPKAFDVSELYADNPRTTTKTNSQDAIPWTYLLFDSIVVGAVWLSGRALLQDYRLREDVRRHGVRAALSESLKLPPFGPVVQALETQLGNEKVFKKALEANGLSTSGYQSLRTRVLKWGQNAVENPEIYRPMKTWLTVVLAGIFIVFTVFIVLMIAQSFGWIDVAHLLHMAQAVGPSIFPAPLSEPSQAGAVPMFSVLSPTFISSQQIDTTRRWFLAAIAGTAMTAGSASVLLAQESPAPEAISEGQKKAKERVKAKLDAFVKRLAKDFADQKEPALPAVLEFQKTFPALTLRERVPAGPERNTIAGMTFHALNNDPNHLSVNVYIYYEFFEMLLDLAERNPVARELCITLVINQGSMLDDMQRRTQWYLDAAEMVTAVDKAGWVKSNPKTWDLPMSFAAHAIEAQMVGNRGVLQYWNRHPKIPELLERDIASIPDQTLRNIPNICFDLRKDEQTSRFDQVDLRQKTRILTTEFWKSKPGVMQALLNTAYMNHRLKAGVVSQEEMLRELPFTFLNDPRYVDGRLGLPTRAAPAAQGGTSKTVIGIIAAAVIALLLYLRNQHRGGNRPPEARPKSSTRRGFIGTIGAAERDRQDEIGEPVRIHIEERTGEAQTAKGDAQEHVRKIFSAIQSRLAQNPLAFKKERQVAEMYPLPYPEQGPYTEEFTHAVRQALIKHGRALGIRVIDEFDLALSLDLSDAALAGAYAMRLVVRTSLSDITMLQVFLKIRPSGRRSTTSLDRLRASGA